MSAQEVVLQDKNGNDCYSDTLTRKVYDNSNGNRLDQIIDGIEAALGQPNTGTTADRNYAKGKHIYHVPNKELYIAKSAISSGASFNKASGGNVEVVCLGDEIASLGSDLTSKITGSWVNIPVQTPSADITTYQSDQYRTSAYIVRGGLCYVNLAIKVNADIGDTSKVVLPSGILPAPSIPYSIQATFKPPAWSSFGTPNSQISAESLYQGNVLYIRKAVAGDYSLSFVYPVASP